MTRKNYSTPPREQRGFALLVIFLIAAAVAFTMYQELPRAAFESARDKEQLLMDRGNQYKRAIQLFYAENKRYPAELKDLESFSKKRYLRRRYVDPMTGQDEWRLVHTNGSFLTDSLVQKPPAQNAGGGLPGQGQTPGGGPLGANNLNTTAATDSANNSSNPATGVPPPVLNPMAQQRPSDRRFPTGPGFPQGPGSNPGAPGIGGANSFGANPGAYDPNDPRTWPPITVATPNAPPGQPQQQVGGGQAVRGNSPFGATPPGGAGGAYQPMPSQFGGAQTSGTYQPMPSQFGAAQSSGTYQPMPAQFGAAPTQIQPNLGPNGFGQGNGQGGGNPQPATMFNPNTLDPNGLAAAPNPNADPNVLFPPAGSQPTPGQQPAYNPGPASMAQASLALGGFNSQVPPSPQANPALPGNNSNNPALNAIDNALFRPNQAPAAGITGSPGIAGVATKFKGPSIKAYHKRTKYQEWEFIYDPAENQPGATQPGANPLGPNQPGSNQPGQAGAAGQNSQQTPSPFGTGSGGAPGGATPSNPFSTPNPFAPSAAPQQ